MSPRSSIESRETFACDLAAYRQVKLSSRWAAAGAGAIVGWGCELIMGPVPGK
jgi:hypothetical protein